MTNVSLTRALPLALCSVALAMVAACEPAAETSSYDPCDPDYCPASSTCRDVGGSAYCDCDEGYVGSPGVSASACYEAVVDHGVCADTATGIVCTCDAGYAQPRNVIGCAEVALTCADLTCGANAHCQLYAAGAVCECNLNYTGDGTTCTRVGVPCSPACGAHASCGAGDVCACDAGYFGDGYACFPEETAAGRCTRVSAGSPITCECNPGYEHARPENVACSDIDECDLPDQGGCGAWCTNTEGGSLCRSTVADETSPYWADSCDPDFSHYAGQTQLVADCRCGENRLAGGELGLCQRPSSAAERGFAYGSGPRVHDIAANLPRVLTGVMDQATRKIYLGIGYTNPSDSYIGAIMEVDADTGARRIVAGLWPDEFGGTVYGSGMTPYLPEVQNLALGPDGYLYAWVRNVLNNAQIVRVDRATGAMTVLWKEDLVLSPEQNDPAHAQCSNGSTAPGGRRVVQVMERGFAIEPSGDFLLSVIANGAAAHITPIGIIRVKKDGSECTWVRRASAGAENAFYGQDIGSGAAPQPGVAFRAFGWVKDKLWAIDNFNHMYELDPANGWRTRTFASGLADDWIIYDAARDVTWLGGTGGGANNIVAYHFDEQPANRWAATLTCANSSREGYECVSGPLFTCCMNHNPMFLDETTGHLIVQHDVFGTVRLEVETGNAVTFSL
ncbi:MAG: hypothetical protein KC635_15170 [Myxococcales bacterium]|nr:hypothetical protein [Myxococcales bacterium]MCB9736876.1 hypothetical protein [Deltaproteobacteria bacterium]